MERCGIKNRNIAIFVGTTLISSNQRVNVAHPEQKSILKNQKNAGVVQEVMFLVISGLELSKVAYISKHLFFDCFL